MKEYTFKLYDNFLPNPNVIKIRSKHVLCAATRSCVTASFRNHVQRILAAKKMYK